MSCCVVSPAAHTLDVDAYGTPGSESLEDQDAALQAVLLASLSESQNGYEASEDIGSSQARAADV